MLDMLIAFLYRAILGVPVMLASSAVGGVFPVSDEPCQPRRISELG